MKFSSQKYPFTVGSEIQAICTPLFQTDICFFEYIRSFADGSFLTLTNQLDWFEHYLKKEYYNVSFTRHPPKSYQEGYLFIKDTSSPCVTDAETIFNICHTIVLIEPSGTSCDFYIFGAKREDQQVVNFYLNHLDFLKKFTYYFQDKAKEIIAKHTKNKFKSPLILEKSHHPQNNIFQESIEGNLLHQHYPLFKNRHIHLTQREIDCVKWLSQGKSSEEIGIILDLSKRTIEAHIVSAKNKIGCYKTAHLIYLSHKLSLI